MLPTSKPTVWIHSLDYEHILSGIIKCPVCGSGMYGNVNRKKHPDGGHYRDYFYYACKHRTFVNGHKCTYRKQWNEDKINAAVEEVIRKLVNNEKFKAEIQKHIGNSIDTEELDREHAGLQDRLKQVTGAKSKLASQMDNLSVSDKHYDKKYEDMQIRLDKLYDEIEEIEASIEAVETRLYNIKQEKISGDNVYQFLLFFDKLYDRFTDLEKKTFMKSFLEEVNIYEAEEEDDRILRSLKFRFPVFSTGKRYMNLIGTMKVPLRRCACWQGKMITRRGLTLVIANKYLLSLCVENSIYEANEMQKSCGFVPLDGSKME